MTKCLMKASIDTIDKAILKISKLRSFPVISIPKNRFGAENGGPFLLCVAEIFGTQKTDSWL